MPSECKENLLVVNKADLLSAEMRAAWATYFRSKGIKFAYFSAKLEKEALDAEDDEDGDDTLGILARAQELAREKVGLPAKSSSSVLCSDKPISRTDLLMLLTERAAGGLRRRAVEKMKMVRGRIWSWGKEKQTSDCGHGGLSERESHLSSMFCWESQQSPTARLALQLYAQDKALQGHSGDLTLCDVSVYASQHSCRQRQR